MRLIQGKSSIHLVLGGRRSGKSSHAEKIALGLSDHPIYLATSRIWDPDHRSRIEKHRRERSQAWETVERDVEIHTLDSLRGRTVLLEDIPLWLTNLFFDRDENREETFEYAIDIFSKFILLPERLVIVSSEVGLGLHPETKAGRDFADILGLINQEIAGIARGVDLVVAGIPLPIKGDR